MSELTSAKVNLTPMTLFGHANDREEAAKRVLELLKDIELSGGSSAFEAWLKETDYGTKLSIAPEVKQAPSNQEANSFASFGIFDYRTYGGWCEITSFVRTSVKMGFPDDDIVGSGNSWGVGAGYVERTNCDLDVYYPLTLDRLASLDLTFQIYGVQVGLGAIKIVLFNKEDGAIVADLILRAGGVMATVGVKGTFTFRKI